ncbi:hypothetical protein RchiOBHm_Chr5g0003971 [Rosa chinensis]|uniref:Uncharacterized protein n=1 Tax=Rosa chinensis TaxID=74649 RepID=A0A2P6Q2V8_ROSCH|nr:hypothetical protein RchiOBHm_Chr5g0003971 [Rosa chinensis]
MLLVIYIPSKIQQQHTHTRGYITRGVLSLEDLENLFSSRAPEFATV